MLDLRQFAALRAIARTGSTAAAARELGWSQPTVTHHLRQLSRDTGEPVVRSSAAGTTLTMAGRLWMPHAEAILERAARARAGVAAALEDGRHRCRLGVFPTAAARLLPAIVSAAAAADVHIDVTESENESLWTDFDALRLDAVITYTTDPEARTGGETLFEERFGILLGSSHPLAGRPRVGMADLRCEAWILGRDPDDAIDALLRELAAVAGFVPRAGQRTDDYRVAAAYAAAGLGVALVPELALPIRADDCRFIPLVDRAPTRRVSLHFASGVPEEVRDVLRRGLMRP